MALFLARYRRADPVSACVYPIAFVGGIAGLGLALVEMAWVAWWGVAPFLVAVTYCASRICVRAGFLGAALAIAAHWFLFAAPRWSFAAPSSENVIGYVAMVVAVLLFAAPRPDATLGDEEVPPGRPLPFVKPHNGNGKINGTHSSGPNCRFWSVPPATGAWREDNALGAEYGRIYVQAWLRDETGPILPWIVRDMVRSGQWSGIESGFLGVIGRAALRRGYVGLPREMLLDAPDGTRTRDNADHFEAG